MAQNRNRTNHVKIDNLPTHMTDCRELLSHLELAGNVQVGMELTTKQVGRTYELERLERQQSMSLIYTGWFF